MSCQKLQPSYVGLRLIQLSGNLNVAGKTISVWLKGDDAKRYESAADARGLTVASFLKRTADAALVPSDPRQDIRAFAADLRADLRGEIAKVAEAVALISEGHDETQRLFHVFLNDLNEQQIQAVKLALDVGRQQGQAEAMAHENKSLPKEPGYRSPTKL